MGSPLVEAWKKEKQQRSTNAGGGTRQSLSPAASAILDDWNRQRPERMRQKLVQLDSRMQNLQKSVQSRKSYWDGQDEQLRRQANEMNRLMDSIDRQAKLYGMESDELTAGLDAYRQYYTDLTAGLDADAKQFSQFKNKQEFDDYVKAYEEQKAEYEKYQKMSVADIDKELERLKKAPQALETVYTTAIDRYDAIRGVSDFIFRKNTTKAKDRDENYQHIKQQQKEQEKLYAWRDQKLMEPLSDKAVSALDSLLEARVKKKSIEQKKDDGQDYDEQFYREAIMQESQAVSALNQMGYTNVEELADARKRVRHEQVAENALKQVEQFTKIMPITNNVLAVGAQGLRGVSALADMMTVVKDDRIDVNDEYHALGRYADTVRSTTQKMWEDKYDDPKKKYAARIAYNVANGIADNLVRMGVGYAAGGAAYASDIAGLIMGSQVMSQAVVEGKQKGYSDEKALAMGLVQATIEAATEKYSVDVLLKDSKNVLLQIGKSFLAEGGEEVTSNVANYLADALANGDQNELTQAYRKYCEQGMSDKQALTQVFEDIASENIEAFLVGGLSGGVMGAGSAGMYGYSRTQYGQTAIDQKMVDELLREADERNDKELQRYVDKINKNKENPDARTVGNLVLRLNELGVDTDAIARKYEKGKALTEADMYEIQNNPEVQQKLRDKGIEPTGRVAAEEGDAGYKALASYADEYYKDPATKKTFLESFQPGQNADVYKAAFDAAYRYGAEGYDMDTVDEKCGGLYGDNFTREQAIRAQNAGYQEGNAAVSEPLARVQLEDNSPDVIRAAEFKTGVTLLNVSRPKLSAVVRTQLAVIQNFGKEKGISFIIVDSTNGRYTQLNGEQLVGTNKIVINLDAESGIYEEGKKKEHVPLLLRTAGHEVLHYIQQQNSKAAEKIRDLVVEHFEKTGEYTELAQKYAERGYETGIDWELTADSLFDVMSDEEFLAKYAAADAGTLKTLRDTISAFIRKINEALKKLVKDNDIHKQIYESLNKDKQTLEKLRRMFNDALDSLSSAQRDGRTDAQRSAEQRNDNSKKSKKPSRYDYGKSFDEQIDDFMAGKFPKYEELLVCKTPEIWQKIGLNALPVTINQSHLKKALYGTKDADHTLGETMVRDLPKLLADPVAIIRSQAEATPDRLVVIVAEKVNGHQLIAAVEVDGTARYSEEKINANSIRSTYGKEKALSQMMHAIKKESDNHIELYYLNKKEAFNLMQLEGLQLPNGLHKSGFIHSIDEKGSIVKKKLNSVFDSLQFQRWFGNSQIKNPDGTPKVVYHQTASDFWTFNTDNPGAGAHDSETPNGIFFKDNNHDIGLEGNRQMACYLRMEKPLHFKNRQDANSWYKKNVPGYNAISDKMDAAVGEIDKKMQALETEMFAAETTDERYDALDAEWNKLHAEMAEVEDGFRDQLRERLNKYFLNGGKYDGIILDYDGHRYVGEDRHREDVKTYIVFDNKQIKSATDNIGTFSRNNPDIRLSLKPASSISDEHRALIEENEKYRAVIAKLQQQVHVLQKKTVDPKGVQKLAKEIRAEFKSKYPQAELEQRLTSLFDYIANGEEVDFGEITRLAAGIAKDVIEQGAMNRELAEQYKDMRDYLKSARLQLTTLQRSEMANRYGSYAAFRQQTAGKIGFYVKDGIKLDEKWGELCEQWPEFFKEDEHEAEMPVRLMEAIEATDPYAENPYGMNTDEMAYDLALRIYDRYYEIPQVGSLQGAIYDLRRDYKQKYKAALKEARERVRAESREYVQQVENELYEERQRSRENLRQTRAEYDERLAEQVARLNKSRENDSRRRMRTQILQSANALAQKLAANSSKKNVPDALKGPVMDLLSTITAYGDSERVTTLNKSFYENLRKANDRLTDLYKDGTDDDLSGLYEGSLDITEDFIENMRQLRREVEDVLERFGGTDERHILNEMDLLQLEMLNRVLVQMHHIVTKAGKLHQNAMYESANEIAADTIRELSEMDERKAHIDGLESIEKFMFWTNGTPYYVFKRFGKGGMSIFNEVQNGWDKFAFLVRDARDYALEAYTDDEVKAWEKEVHEFKDKTGKEFKLTAPQIMSIYCLSKRDAARRHLLGGGIVPGKVGKVQQSQRYKLDQQTLDDIVGKLSQRQVEVADKLQAFMATKCAEWGNAVSMKRFGIRIFTEQNYFPMAVDKNTVKTEDTPPMGNRLFELINRSFTKELNEKASNALYALNIFDVFTQHASEMAQYNALALPVLDMMKWYHGAVVTGEEMETDDETGKEKKVSIKQNVRGEIERVYGQQAQQYVEQFVRDINGSASEDRATILKKVTRNFKIAKVGANLNVALVQPTAYFRAINVINPKYLLSALQGVRHFKKHIDDMQNNTGIGLWKSMGFFDVDVNRSLAGIIKHKETKADKVREWSMKGAEWGDSITWGLLFYACQKEAYKEKGLAFGSKECNEAAAEHFREIVYATQVVDSTMTRSALMRSKSLQDQIVSAFMSEPTLSYNMLMDQYFNYSKDVRSGMTKKAAFKKNGGGILRAFGTYAITALVTTIMQSLTGALRDDDDDPLEESGIKQYWNNGKNAFKGNAWEEFVPLSKIPYIKHIYSLIFAIATKGTYNTSDPTTQIFSDVARSIFSWLGKYDPDSKSSETTYGALYKTLIALSDASGLPGSNLIRDVVAVWNTTVGAENPELKVRRYEQTQKEQLELAFKDGPEQVRAKVDDLIEEKAKQRQKDYPNETPEASRKEVQSGVKSSVTSTAKDIYKGGDESGARELMQASGLYTGKDIQKNIDKWSKESASG